MKKVLFTLALIFTLLISCEKEKEERSFLIGNWTIDLSYGYNALHCNFTIVDVVQNIVVIDRFSIIQKNGEIFEALQYEQEYNLKFYYTPEERSISFVINSLNLKVTYSGTYSDEYDVFVGDRVILIDNRTFVKQGVLLKRGSFKIF